MEAADGSLVRTRPRHYVALIDLDGWIEQVSDGVSFKELLGELWAHLWLVYSLCGPRF